VKATWRIMLEGACDEALLAVDLYNQPQRPRRLEGFFVHMHLAWLYLLQAEFRRGGVDFRFHLPSGRIDRVDGEPKTWDLQRCVVERWQSDGPIRKNLELTISLRNKIEHRYEAAITAVTSGYAQALVLNFEEELTSAFDPSYSLGAMLRFPIFVGSLTGLGAAKMEELRAQLPKSTSNLLAHFEADLDPAIAQDQRYEFRINLIPKLGPKSSTDRAFSFVREDELTDEQRPALSAIGQTGTVVVREQVRSVSSAGKMKPATVSAQSKSGFRSSSVSTHIFRERGRNWRAVPQAEAGIPSAPTSGTAATTSRPVTTSTRRPSSRRSCARPAPRADSKRSSAYRQ
jgi:hypothetical protein